MPNDDRPELEVRNPADFEACDPPDASWERHRLGFAVEVAAHHLGRIADLLERAEAEHQALEAKRQEFASSLAAEYARERGEEDPRGH